LCTVTFLVTVCSIVSLVGKKIVHKVFQKIMFIVFSTIMEWPYAQGFQCIVLMSLMRWAWGLGFN
jgi:hypothetical protein